MEISRIISALKKEYQPGLFARRNHKEPYQVLVSCILSLRTKDQTTHQASNRLFKLAKKPRQMVKLKPGQIQRAIYPVGFYRVKSKTILDISRTLVRDYNSQVPDKVEELVKLKGVGRKTANIVVTFGYNKPGIAVDTHAHRISNRLGIVKTSQPDETELELRKKLPKRYWIDFNELMVRHGQNICTPRLPWCSRCVLRKHCQRTGVTRSR